MLTSMVITRVLPRVSERSDKRLNKITELQDMLATIVVDALDPNVKTSKQGYIEQAEDTEFKEFLQPIEVSAPVLTKVETPTLELNITSTPISSTKEKETGVDYIARNEPKYSDITPTDSLDERKQQFVLE